MTIQLSMFGAKYDGKQADLFVAPVSPTAPAVPEHLRGQIPFVPVPSAPAEPMLCAECGDELPPRAKACPNCYTKVAKGGK
jgi:hypothetical protein